MNYHLSTRTTLRLVASVVLLFGTLLALSHPFGTIPPIGATFNPYSGVWAAGNLGASLKSQTIRIPSLSQVVTVSYDKYERPTINATNEHDLFETIGILQARFRLFEMDLLRRAGEGTLAAVIGPSELSTDEFQLTLGLKRTAEAEAANIKRDPTTFNLMNAYTEGINYEINKLESSNRLPAEFRLLNYKPAPWTMVDSLVIQGDLTELLDFTTAPIDRTLAANSLGANLTNKIFPTFAPNPQTPYDKGPFKALPLSKITRTIPGSSLTPVSTKAKALMASVRSTDRIVSPPALNTTQLEGGLAQITNWYQSIDPILRRIGSESNNFAISGKKSSTGGAILAGDPHLAFQLPSIWYQLTANSPSISLSGVSVPGLPGILIGHNRDISWSLTDTQNQSVFYYREKTSPAHPNQYFWNGKWRNYTTYSYQIAQKGGSTVDYQVRVTVHGPVMTNSGVAASAFWFGAIPSDDIRSLYGVYKASNFSQFKAALSNWLAPTQNFAYADNKGNIGIIAPGIYAQVRSGDPRQLLDGTGASDVIGTIPYSEVPQSYDPKSGFIFSANQRPVSTNYPYFIGDSNNAFDPGYRSRTIFNFLNSHNKITPTQIEGLQTSYSDLLASEMVPRLISAIRASIPSGAFTLTIPLQKALNLLSSWNYKMTSDSKAAPIWWYFINNFLPQVFNPIWTSHNVPTSTDSNLKVSINNTSLLDDAEALTLDPKTGPSLGLQISTPSQLDSAMFAAFQSAITSMQHDLGHSFYDRTWGSIHKDKFVSIANIDSLSYGPFSAGGDPWTVNAAEEALLSKGGPSWRMVAQPGKSYVGIIPGGQNGNELSNNYTSEANLWRSNQYLDMTSTQSPNAIWTLSK
ncbi:MAG: penicillin acylase family protein [Actinomycetota bacterium]|nr:penicillin acylase family protein [Actinomycetota bacterium]